MIEPIDMAERSFTLKELLLFSKTKESDYFNWTRVTPKGEPRFLAAHKKNEPFGKKTKAGNFFCGYEILRLRIIHHLASLDISPEKADKYARNVVLKCQELDANKPAIISEISEFFAHTDGISLVIKHGQIFYNLHAELAAKRYKEKAVQRFLQMSDPKQIELLNKAITDAQSNQVADDEKYAVEEGKINE
jgi:hypothetical protein